MKISTTNLTNNLAKPIKVTNNLVRCGTPNSSRPLNKLEQTSFQFAKDALVKNNKPTFNITGTKIHKTSLKQSINIKIYKSQYLTLA